MADKIIKTVIVDDEKTARDATVSALSNFERIKVVADVENISELMAVLKENKVDLAFLDIEMPDNTGFELAKYINTHYPTILIIFLTGHAGFAQDCYDFEPIDFLTKPINILRLERAIQRVEKTLSKKFGDNSANKQTKIGINFEGGYQIINIDNIRYIEKRGRKVILLTEKEELVSKYSLGQLELMLKNHDFFRCHQSFIIPLFNIKSVQNNMFGKSYFIELRGSKENIPLSRNKYAELKDLLETEGIVFC